jgi:hypothetical protein
MRVGEKCVFTVEEDLFGGRIKKDHRYTGKALKNGWVQYRTFTLKAKTIESVEKPKIKKEKAPTASDYKNFGDVAFEMAIRFRDNWTSVISGQKFEEGDWNGLQAGHGVSRQHWATRHNPLNCHAITSGQNFHMSLGSTTTIAKYWAYVAKIYGQDVVDDLINGNHPTPKLSISYLKEDCIRQYEFLKNTLNTYLTLKTKTFVSADPDYYIKWRCEKFSKAKTDGIMKVLKIIKGEQ